MTDAASRPRPPTASRGRSFRWLSSSLSDRLSRISNPVVALLISALVAIAYLRDLGRNPYGFFCDEALIGVRANQVLDGTHPEGTFSLFYSHFGTTSGSLPIYAAAPFVWLLGLSEYSVRFASVFFMMATFAALYLTFRHLNVAPPWLPVLILALTPIDIHMSRINFGHAPSLFLLALGYHLYLRGRDARRIVPVIGGAITMGLSAYGYPGFYIATPVFLGVVLVTELTFERFRLGRVKLLFTLIGGALICLLPNFYRGTTDPEYSKRFDDNDKADYGLI